MSLVIGSNDYYTRKPRAYRSLDIEMPIRSDSKLIAIFGDIAPPSPVQEPVPKTKVNGVASKYGPPA